MSRLAWSYHRDWKICCLSCLSVNAEKHLSDAATIGQHSGTSWTKRFVSPKSSKTWFPNPQPKILAILSPFEDFRQQFHQNRPFRNQIRISKVSNGSCHFEQHMYFANKKHSKSGSGIGFETFCVIFKHHIMTKLMLWPKVWCQSPHCKHLPKKSRLLNI